MTPQNTTQPGLAGDAPPGSPGSPGSTGSTGSFGPIMEHVRAHSASLSAAEQRVARAILSDPVGVVHLSVSDLAQIAGSSPATVVRFCQALGLRGFQELKLALARESIPAERQLLDEIEPGDGPAEVTSKVLSGAANALQSAAQSVNSEAMGQVAELLGDARRIVFAAVGTSASLAGDVAYRFTTIGLDASFAADVHIQHVTARMLTAEDLCFAISHTGSTVETLATVRAAAAAGAATVALTSFATSPLTELVDHVLVAGSRETAYRIEAMTSRIVHLTILDALFVLLALRQPNAQLALAETADILIEHRL
ncbi:MurR/RpiR family transcriptional regulator [Frankia gtarii]|uniref:MurR/RpiR family transcriptional regulator n=1 Tax=Frankia gtarii TaxID=2950102 RepID=UPI0021BFDB1F|nr:MurR/RpiR family transcriptional regulator [Frankia gtarii]